MLRTLKVLFLLSCFAFVSCSTSPETPPPSDEWPYGLEEWTYKEGAIKITVKADPNLNLYEGNPNTLHLCVYQLRNPNSINQMASNMDGLYQLLDQNCGFSDGSVAGSKALTVYPGETNTYILDRAEGAKYVAFVAGYFSLENDRIMRLVRVPVTFIEKKTGLFKSVRIPQADQLDASLILGPEQIQKIETN